jgi:hypothetical protein
MEIWEQYKPQGNEDQHFRIHPILSWTELDIWEYTRQEKLPLVDLYLSNQEGKRFRSIGCERCCAPVESKAKSVDDININDFKNYQVKFNSCGGGLYTRNDGLINKCNELVYHIETFIEYHSLYHTLLSYINIDEVKKGLIEMFSEQYSDFKTIEEILVKEYKMPTMKDAVERYGEMFTNYGDNIIEDARKELINLIKQALKINKNDKLKLNDVDLELLPRSIKGKPDNITRSIDEIYTLSAIRVYNREFMEKYNKAMTYEVD